MAQDMFRAFSGTLGLSAGGIEGGLGAMLASTVPGSVRNAVRAGGVPAASPRVVSGRMAGSAGAANAQINGD